MNDKGPVIFMDSTMTGMNFLKPDNVLKFQCKSPCQEDYHSSNEAYFNLHKNSLMDNIATNKVKTVFRKRIFYHCYEIPL